MVHPPRRQELSRQMIAQRRSLSQSGGGAWIELTVVSARARGRSFGPNGPARRFCALCYSCKGRCCAIHGLPLKIPDHIRHLSLLAALALCFGLLYASQHWHDTDCGDNVCAVCVYSDAGGAIDSEVSPAFRHLNSGSAGASGNSLFPASRPYKAHRPRAPPIS